MNEQSKDQRDDRSEQGLVLAIVLFAFVLRVGMMLAFRTYEFEDDWHFGFETGRVAAAIAGGEGFSSPFPKPSGPTAWLSPGYPVLLAAIFKTMGIYSQQSAVAAIAINSLFSALTCVPLFFLCKEVFGRDVGLAAAVMFAVYPAAVWHSIVTVWDASLFTLMIVTLLYWMSSLSRQPRVSVLLLFGLFIGLVALINPVIIAFVPFVMIWMFVRLNGLAKKRLSLLCVVCVFALLPLVPWLVRNWVVMGEPVVRSNFGVELKLGNTEEVWVNRQEGKSVSTMAKHPSNDEAEFQRFSTLGEIQYADVCFGEAMDWIRNQPIAFLGLTLDRFASFWIGDWSTRNTWQGSLKSSIDLSLLKRVFHALPALLSLIGIAIAMRRGLNHTAALVGILCFLPMVYYLTHVSQRYRFPIEPVLIAFLCYGVRETGDWLLNRVNLVRVDSKTLSENSRCP